MPDAAITAQQQLLGVEELHAWYGESHILHGMSFAVGQGEVVTLLGRNGAGKTTTLRAIMGIVPRRQGSVVFRGSELAGLPPIASPVSASPIVRKSAASSRAWTLRKTCCFRRW